jgi:hypothetical protein
MRCICCRWLEDGALSGQLRSSLLVDKDCVVLDIIDGDSDAKLRLHIFVKSKQNRRKLSLAIRCVHPARLAINPINQIRGLKLIYLKLS